MRVLMICPELPRTEKPGSMAPTSRQIQSLRDLGLEIETIDMHGVRRWKYLQAIPKTRRTIPKVDLVHAHFGYCGWLALLGRALAFRRIPIVMSFMGDDLLGTPKDEQGNLESSSIWALKFNCWIAKYYKEVIVKSPEMQQRLGAVPCHVVPNGVDLGVFTPQDRISARRALGWAAEGYKVLFPGDPSNPRKGFELAKAIVRVAEKKLNATIELIPLWGVKPDQVAMYMNACNAMLMTSLIEGSPNVVKEAMACNANIISVPVGDVHEMLRGVEGCFAGPREAQLLGETLGEALLANRPSTGRRTLQERSLDLEGVAKRIHSIYLRALNQAIDLGLDRKSPDSSTSFSEPNAGSNIHVDCPQTQVLATVSQESP
ncbi:MAG: glycosyltransferase [Planctomycetaceae bacterium]|nr:glycosyltransferase [Planctomycetaceae bacterium]